MTKNRKLYLIIFIIFTLAEIAMLLILGLSSRKLGNFTVDFKTNGGSEVSSVVVKEGETLETSALSSKTGFIFLGWYTDEGFLHSFDFNAPIHTNLTLYARWALIPGTNLYRVVWSYEDGRILEDDRDVVENTLPSFDSNTPYLASTAQYEYLFVGWNPTIQPVTQDVTYYAQFVTKVKTFDINWVVDGTAVLVQHHINYGTTITYPGATPTKAPTVQYSYTFIGWDLDGDDVPDPLGTLTANTTFTAVFAASTRTYTVTWSLDGVPLEIDTNVAYGTTPSYDGATLTRASSVQWDYVFNDTWSPAVAPVVDDITYNAIFTEVLRTYLVTFNVEGELKETDNVDYGTLASYTGATPTKASTVQYTYTFVGWDGPDADALADETLLVLGATNYHAVFVQSLRKYSVVWAIDATTILYTDDQVAYGTIPTYNGLTPTKPADAANTYVFNGTWSPTVAAITSDVTYYAQFTASLRSYTITWMIDATNVYDTTTALYGTTPSVSGTPTKDDAQYTYTFSGWSPAVASVVGNATYTATFTTVVKKYFITWYNYDSSPIVIQTNINYGTTPVFPGPPNPTYADASSAYLYTFAGWDAPLLPIVGNTSFTAVYTTTLKTFTITWRLDASTVLEVDYNVAYGSTPTYDGTAPFKASDATHDYTWYNTWTPIVTTVTADVTYTATFITLIRFYNITFIVDDFSITTPYTYGDYYFYSSSTPSKASDAQYDYTFTGFWASSIGENEAYGFTGIVSEDATYTAIFSATIRQYTITWVLLPSIFGYTLTESFNYGLTPSNTLTFNYNHYDYTVIGWTPALAPVSGDTTYYAQYTMSVETFTVTWDVDGETTQTTHPYGSYPYYLDGTPAKDPTAEFYYLFGGWDSNLDGSADAISVVTSDTTYTAIFSAHTRTYVVYFYEDSSTIIKNQNVLYGNYASIPTTIIVPDQQYFVAWEVEGVSWDVDEPVVEDLYIYAHFASIWLTSEEDSELTIIGVVTSDIYAPNGRYPEIIIPQELDSLPVVALGPNIFVGHITQSVTNLVVPASVVSIAPSALSNLGYLKNITLPFVGTSLNGTGEDGKFAIVFGTTLYDNCFNAGTYKLPLVENITITNDNDIQPRAFNLYAIKSVSLNDEITTIGDNAFELLFNLSYIKLPDNLLTIGNMAFAGCYVLRDLVLPNSLTSIGTRAFESCYTLRSLTIPASVRTIGARAFIGDWGIETVIFENGTTTIGDWAFSGMESLRSVTLPNSLLVIGVNVFNGDYNIESITTPFIGFTAADTNWMSETLGALFGNSYTDLVHYYLANNYYLPRKLTSVTLTSGTVLDDGAFWGASSLTTIVLPDTLLTIGANAFRNCTSLVSLTIPSGLRYINEYAFAGCSELSAIILPNTLLSIGIYAFNQAISLTSIVLPNSLANLGNYAFLQCSGLTSVVVGNMLANIGNGAFKFTTSLTSFVFGSNVSSIGNSAFEDTPALKEINFPPNLTSIEIGAFRRSGLVSVTIPNSVTYIGEYAFSTCNSLVNFVINNNSNQAFPTIEIRQWILEGARSLKSLTIPFVQFGSSSLYNYYFGGLFGSSPAGDSAFYNERGQIPKSLTTLHLGDNATRIGNQGLMGIYSLTTITLGNNLNYIGVQAFQDCTNLTNLVIPSTVTFIGDQAFAFCVNITSLVIPSAVTYLGAGSFSGMTRLTTLTLPFVGTNIDTPVKFASFFINSGANAYLYQINYGGADVHSIPYSLTSINITDGYGLPDFAFAGFESLINVSLPENMNFTTIGNYAFLSCSSLVNLNIPSTVTNIGIFALSATGLSKVILPEGLETIAMSLFAESASLVYVYVPSTVLSIESNAFYNCISLASIDLPEGLNSISTLAFYNCIGITSLVIPSTVVWLGQSALADMASLQSLSVPFVGSSSDTYSSDHTLHYLFDTATNYPSLTYTALYDSAYYYIPYSLKTVNITVGNSDVGIYSIPENAFEKFSFLATVNYPTVISRIGINAFYGIQGTSNMVIPSSITHVGALAFAFITDLITMNIIGSNGGLALGNGIFTSCVNLLTVTFQKENVARIPDQAFANSTSLQNFRVHLSVLEIGSQAFSNCVNLTTLLLSLNTTLVSNNAFELIPVLHIHTNAVGTVASWPAASASLIYHYGEQLPS